MNGILPTRLDDAGPHRDRGLDHRHAFIIPGSALMPRTVLFCLVFLTVILPVRAQDMTEKSVKILNYYPGLAPDSLLTPARHEAGDVVVYLMGGFGYFISFYVKDQDGALCHQKVSIGVTRAKKSAKHPVKPWYDMAYYRWENDSTVAMRLVDSGSDKSYVFSVFGRGNLNGMSYPSRTVKVK